jgi:hypothetical protein
MNKRIRAALWFEVRPFLCFVKMGLRDLALDFTATPLYGTDGSPQLDQANTGGTDSVRANVVTDAAGVVTADFDLGIDAVSAVLMRSNLSNEWLADPSLGALTD